MNDSFAALLCPSTRTENVCAAFFSPPQPVATRTAVATSRTTTDFHIAWNTSTRLRSGLDESVRGGTIPEATLDFKLCLLGRAPCAGSPAVTVHRAGNAPRSGADFAREGVSGGDQLRKPRRVGSAAAR